MVERDNSRTGTNDGVDASDAITRALEELCACVESVAAALPILRPQGLSERLGRVRALAREARMGTAARPRSEPRNGSTESDIQRPYRGQSGGQSHV